MQVIYVDNHLLVVSKEPGVLTQGDATGDPDLLTEARTWVERQFAKPGRAWLGLVHRLDRPVSGVVVFARTSKAAARLSAQFRDRVPRKRYLAIVEGLAPQEARRADWIIEGHRGSRIGAPTDRNAREARLSWTRLGAKRDLSLLEIELETGRRHQIRVQLAAAGHPIVGDLRYGARRIFDGRNLALHAWRLEILHPVGGDRRVFRADPPATWRGWFDREIQDLLDSSDA
ncbi:MAG TPA: RNA pseudouridine synthase [Planctomycetota bacterium]|nr:RNA pseudouridine synthase [Planctomycetota bacterium]